jgi:putative Ca2+/H+ antiporter (TMEM165/GDT1 family)
MDAFFTSTFMVALAEIGDKTQLLALILSARFKKPIPIICGILTATLLNHAAAAWVGEWVGRMFHGTLMRWLLGLSFLATAGWALIPDKMDDGHKVNDRFGVYFTTMITFFFVEIGDKTQIATAMLAAKFHYLVPVVAGTTLGMMLANGPVVFLGDQLSNKLPLKWIRLAAALIFAALGIAVLLGI